MSRDFLDRVTRTLKEGARVVVRESEEVARMAKIRLEISALAGKRDDLWQEIGEKMFTQFEEGREVPAEVMGLCQQVRDVVEKIRGKERELAALRAQGGGRDEADAGEREGATRQAGLAGGDETAPGETAPAGGEEVRCPHCGEVIR